MATLQDLEALNTDSIEALISQGIMQRISLGLPELTDFSPSAPQVVIGEAVAWGAALLLYYAMRQPEAVEEWVLRQLYGASESPATPATANVVLTFSTPAPPGGRTIPAGTLFTGGGFTWTSISAYTYPTGALGNEQSGGIYLYQIPLRCVSTGAKTNVATGIINAPQGTIAQLVSVTNPEPAAGGTDIESYADMRLRYLRAPLDTLLVSDYDYERYIQEYLGGGLVYLVTPRLPDGSSDPSWSPGYVKLAILYPDGTPLSNNPTLRSLLESKSPGGIVSFLAPTVSPVHVSATLNYDAAQTDATTLTNAATAALQAFLRPQGWKYWGQLPNKVWRSDLIATLQALPGVLGVTLTSPSNDVDLSLPYAVPRPGTLNITTVIGG